ncbi:MAG: diguanylate cyclase, partial [Gemmatimonadales bacterium]
MSDELERALDALRREYLTEAPIRIAELRKDGGAFRAGEGGALGSLITRFHRLAGSGGSYGFPEVSEIAREAERFLKSDPPPGPSDAAFVDDAVARLAAAFNRAGARITGPSAALPTTDFAWRATVVTEAGPLREQIREALQGSGFEVAATEPAHDSPDVPLSETPDLVVIAGTENGLDPYAMAAAWSGSRTIRPRGIVLVDTTGRVDRIRAVASGIDTVLPADRISQELSNYAKTLARIGVPPSSVLLVSERQSIADEVTGWLEAANIRITCCDEAMQARDILARDLPDLVLLDTGLTAVDAFTLARLMRQDQRFSLLPMIFLANERNVKDQIEALRAGADHFLSRPLERELLIQLVVNRAERGRRIREMVHRDGLTGLLNHATLMAELEHAVEYARRHREGFSFLMIDVDHFKRINDTYGHLAGDQVLVHLARVFQGAVRASDIIGRYGGEEFGMILPRSGREGAVVLGTKLRESLIDRPAMTREGAVIPVRVSIGVACYPEDATTAGGLAAA